MRVTNNMITSNTKSNINANKVLVDKYNTQMTTQKKINNCLLYTSPSPRDCS